MMWVGVGDPVRRLACRRSFTVVLVRVPVVVVVVVTVGGAATRLVAGVAEIAGVAGVVGVAGVARRIVLTAGAGVLMVVIAAGAGVLVCVHAATGSGVVISTFRLEWRTFLATEPPFDF